MRKGLIILLVISVLGVLVSGIVSAATSQESINLVTAIEVKGNNSVPSEEILNVIKTKVGQKINNEQLQADLQAIYDLGYFYDLRIDPENYLGGVKLIFNVVEHPRINGIEINGTEVISADVLQVIMNVKPGHLLNTNILDQDLRTIEEYYRDQGLVLAYVSDVSISPVNTLQITINEGFLNEILIKGNEKTRDYVIRRELDITPGEVFDLNKVQKNLRDIYNLGLFDSINQKIELADADAETKSNKVNLIIEVDEKKTGQLQLGGAYSSADGWFGYIDASEQNLFGRGQKLGFKWEFGQMTNYELNFYDPWAFGQEFSFGVSLYNTTSRNLKDSEKGKYTRNSKGGSIQIGKPLAEDITGSLKFKYENTLNTFEEEPYGEERGNTGSLTLSAVKDTTDDPYNPGTGGRDMASVEYAGHLLGGDYDFTKLNLEMRRYYPGFKEDHTWAFRLKGGLSLGDLPSHEKFRIGGSETIRGYDQGEFNGDKTALFNVEYRFPVVKNLQGAVFTDVGNSWNNDQVLNLEEFNMSIGAGVRMNTPLGQIRLDYAFGSNGGQPHFSIGQTF